MSVPFSAAEKRQAITRELAYRRVVFVRRVGEGRMKQVEADRQIALFEAIEADYRKLEEGERLL